jgi:hypothetical protein
MRLILSAALVACISGCATTVVPPGEVVFHSWYHGYFLHTVWGLGEASASSGTAHVLCGKEKIPLRPVFDTHMYAGHAPGQGQTEAEALEHNQALLKRFKNQGITCVIPAADAGGA